MNGFVRELDEAGRRRPVTLIGSKLAWTRGRCSSADERVRDKAGQSGGSILAQADRIRRHVVRTPTMGRAAALLSTTAAILVAPGMVAAAAAIDFDPVPGAYVANTTDLTITGPGRNDLGVDQNGVAVFTFDNVTIPVGATITVRGSRPFKIVASGSLSLAGMIDGKGTNAVNLTSTAFDGGPGGGKGGVNFTQPGQGPGGGRSPSSGNNGAGGGGFGGTGARGGVSGAGTGGAAGATYGDLNAQLQGGSGGGGGSASDPVGGGGGGGAIALQGNTVTIAATGTVSVNGGNGAVGGFGASGGGSGGGIVMRGETVDVNGTLSAKGGDGGAGGCCGDGGAGGGGRINYQYRTLLSSGTTTVAGGTSGIAQVFSGTGCNPCGHGGLSPDATGTTGKLTMTPAPVVATTAATAVASTTATINGTVKPNGNATTYHFDFGTSTAYGTRIPAVDASAGSDATVHAVSQDLIGLTPSITYHYRLVGTSALGFVTTGADMTFATPAIPPPPLPSASFAGSPASVRVSKTGRFSYRFVATPAASGKITFTSTKRVKIGAKKRKLTLTKAFTAPATAKVAVKLKLSRKYLKALKHAKQLRFKVTVALAAKTFTTKVTLKAPKKT